MTSGTVGVAIQEASPRRTIEIIERAEALGVPIVWLTTGTGADAMLVFAAAAMRTRTIGFGTAIVPTFPRHPLVLAQQASDLGQLAPGRLRLGVGPSHRETVEDIYGIPHRRPHEHLREYVTVLKAALSTGAVDFDGARFHVHARLPYHADVPVLVSALQARSFELAGAVADGAISWLCPAPYLGAVAVPAIERGARAAGRACPPLVGHAFVVVDERAAAVEELARERLAGYLRRPFYLAMLRAAGFPEASDGQWSERMLSAVLLHGSETVVADRIREFLRVSGASEMIASILAVGPDTAATTERTLRLVGSLRG